MVTIKKLTTCLNFIKKQSRPIQENVLVEIDGLYCTDNETFVKIKNNYDLNKGYQHISTLGLKPSVELNDTLQVCSFSDISIDRLMVNIKDLEYMLKFASKDETRPFLNGIAITQERLAACNGHIINFKSLDGYLDKHLKFPDSKNSYIMPSAGLKVLIKLCKAYKFENITLNLGELYTTVSTSLFDFKTQNIDREYPKLGTVIPLKSNTEIEITDFINFKELKPLFKKTNYGSVIKKVGEELIFVIGETKQEFKIGNAPIDLDDDFSIGFNASYLDLASRGQKSFVIKIVDILKPCEVNGSIVMPLKL